MRNTFILLVLLVMTACSNDDEDNSIDFTAQNDQEIQDYMAANNLTATKTNTGLYYRIETVGGGSQPSSTSNVTVAYKGYYTNGNTFDESNSNGISFSLQQVIKGWTEGIPYFKEGGSGKLFIPAHLGYGSYARNGIPGGSVLIFDINLISVN